MSLNRRKYASHEDVSLAGQVAYDLEYSTSISNGETVLQSIRNAKTACQQAKVMKADQLISEE